MSLGLTVFKSIFDNRTHRKMEFDSWDEFKIMLRQLSRQPGYKAKKGEKNPPMQPSPLISPASYIEGATRSNANVVDWASWAALDVDDSPNVEFPTEKFAKTYRNVCYSTASSTKEKPKFRAVFPLKRPVPNAKIRHFWYALQKEFSCQGDEQCKDLSRMYYIPAIYPGADNFFYDYDVGDVLDPDELMAKHPFVQRTGNSFIDRLPENIKKEVLAYRKEQATNTAVHWSSYRDCPFVNKKLVKEYESMSGRDGSGRYRMIYKIMTSIACQAVNQKYPITASQVASLARELDANTSRIYQKRPLEKEADRAIEYAYSVK